MANLFEIVGHHRDEPDWLLLRGDDERYYACAIEDLARGASPTPTETSEAWEVESPSDIVPDGV